MTMSRTVKTSSVAEAAAARLTERLLSKTRDGVSVAHIRALQWLACLAAGAVAIPALWAARGTTPWDTGGPAALLAILGCVTAVLAAVSLVLALVPRSTGSDPVGPVPRMVAELCRLSRLAVVKSRYVQAGAVLTATAGALLVIASL
jgi:hypothetical protein